MLQSLGLIFDGRNHSGLDDSINIARIALELMKVRFDFFFVLVNNTICLIIGWLCTVIK
jgi:inhibitor of KinA sporulation pathway (predicted exonuclease)